jgi:hypothetical protein
MKTLTLIVKTVKYNCKAVFYESFESVHLTVLLQGEAHGCGRKKWGGGRVEGELKKRGTLTGEDKLFMSLQLVGE